MKKSTFKQAVKNLKAAACNIAERDQNAHYCADSSSLIPLAAEIYAYKHKGGNASQVYEFMLATRVELEREITKRYGVKYATGPTACGQDITELYLKRKVSRVLAIASGIIDCAIGSQAQELGMVNNIALGNGLGIMTIKH